MSSGTAFRATDLAVVIPTRHRWEMLGRCLDALAAQSRTGFEIIVVADGRDQFPDLGDHAGAVTLLDQDHAGPGVARNLGIAHSRRPLILLMGDDMMAAPDLVAAHLEAHNRRPAPADAVLGLVRWHPDSARGPIQQWLEWSGTQFDLAGLSEGQEAGWARFYSSNASFKRQLFERVGGFDPDFAFLYEDTELGWRLDQAGMRLWFEPGALTLHDHRYDWSGLRRRFETAARAERRMTAKHAWFEPWFRAKAIEALTTTPPSPVWVALADRLPDTPLRQKARDEANRWYHRQLAPFFLNAWAAEQDVEELAAYLGDEFDLDRLHRHTHVIEDELAAAPDEASFYRTSQAYLYDLTAFAAWETKIPYRTDVARFAPPGSKLLDYGCGIGTDGLRLGELGYRVDFADFDNPSTRYLRWRLGRRHIDARVYDIDTETIDPGYHLAYAFDVIEHVDDPFALLNRLEAAADLVAVNFLEPDPHDTHLHHQLPLKALMDHAEAAGLLRYRLYHHRSHLVIYRSPRAPASAPSAPGRADRSRLRSGARRRLGPVLSGPQWWRAPGAYGGKTWN